MTFTREKILQRLYSYVEWSKLQISVANISGIHELIIFCCCDDPVFRSASGTATKDAGALAAATVGAGITGAIM